MKLYGMKEEGKVVKGLVFEKKAEAKQKRDELNGGKPAELVKAEKPVKFTVTLGPDHPRYS